VTDCRQVFSLKRSEGAVGEDKAARLASNFTSSDMGDHAQEAEPEIGPFRDERVLRMELMGGRAFIDYDSKQDGTSSGSRTPRQFFVLYGSFGSQRFRSEPVEASTDPGFSEIFDLQLAEAMLDARGLYRSMPTMAELLRLDVPIRIAFALVTVARPGDSR